MSPADRKHECAELLAAARLICALATGRLRLRHADRHDMRLATRRMRKVLDRLEQAATDRAGLCLCGKSIALHFLGGRKLDCAEVR